MKALVSLILISLLLASCSTVRPGADAFQSAEAAIARAEAAGAEEHAPVEMRFARERLEGARKAMDMRKYEIAFFLIEESEINSELAIELTRTSIARRQVNELRRSNEVLLEELQQNFGEEFE